MLLETETELRNIVANEKADTRYALLGAIKIVTTTAVREALASLRPDEEYTSGFEAGANLVLNVLRSYKP